MTLQAVVITGASSGIGEAAAQLLAQHGFVAFAGVRSEADGARIAAIHENVRPLSFDVTDAASIDAAAHAVAESGLPLRALVNNAGIAIGGPLEFLPLDLLQRQFAVNVFGAVAVTQAFLPLLRVARGRIIFMGSVAGRLAVPFIAAYSASKFALRAISDAMRLELRSAGVSVSLVEPGNVKTPIWRKGRDSRNELLRRLGPRALELYGVDLQAAFRRTEDAERSGMPVERVSRAVLHAVTSPRPRSHYLVGSKLASVIGALPAFVSDRVFDR